MLTKKPYMHKSMHCIDSEVVWEVWGERRLNVHTLRKSPIFWYKVPAFVLKRSISR